MQNGLCYWTKDEKLEVQIGRDPVSTNRFRTIKQNIHLSDNMILNRNDKLTKISSIIKINEKLREMAKTSLI